MVVDDSILRKRNGMLRFQGSIETNDHSWIPNETAAERVHCSECSKEADYLAGNTLPHDFFDMLVC